MRQLWIRRPIGAWPLPALAALLLLSGCALLARPTQAPPMTPVEVVTKFYRWYIGYPANPLVDEAYKSSPYLSEELIQEIEETLASFANGRSGPASAYDPILLAQDIPESFTVEEESLSGDRATVIVHLFWGGNPTPSDRRVELERVRQDKEVRWKIVDIRLAEG
jgi:hypothetical protein